MENANTRKAYVRLANESVGDPDSEVVEVVQFGINSNQRFQATFIELYNQTVINGSPVRYLQGDGQLSFNSRDTVARIYKPRGIIFTPFLRTPQGTPMYSNEGIINRLMRTLRHLNAALGYGEVITPRNLKRVVDTYNSTPNLGLYKLTRNRKLSPDDITPEGEMWLAAETDRLNEEKRRQFNFYLPVGTRAQVEQYRDSFGRRRSRFLRGYYQIMGQDKNKVLLTNGRDRVQVARSMVFPRRFTPR
jgi:hypothetical protein